MLTLINGSKGAVRLAKGSNNSLRVILANDDGSSINLTGDSVDLIVYDRTDRYNAAIATHSGDTLTVPTAGFATVAIDDSELTYGPGTYYLCARWTDVSASKVFFGQPFVLEIY